jgi:hypothetical protein
VDFGRPPPHPVRAVRSTRPSRVCGADSSKVAVSRMGAGDRSRRRTDPAFFSPSPTSGPDIGNAAPSMPGHPEGAARIRLGVSGVCAPGKCLTHPTSRVYHPSSISHSRWAGCHRLKLPAAYWLGGSEGSMWATSIPVVGNTTAHPYRQLRAAGRGPSPMPVFQGGNVRGREHALPARGRGQATPAPRSTATDLGAVC